VRILFAEKIRDAIAGVTGKFTTSLVGNQLQLTHNTGGNINDAGSGSLGAPFAVKRHAGERFPLCNLAVTS
jgi:hypothetical protein